MTYITYANKSYINQNANVPTANKVTDSDMNEIKNVVNSNYDTEKADIETFYYKNNDTVILGSSNTSTFYITNGYISSSTTSLFFTIITPKRLDNISSITVNNLKLEARGQNGYLNSQSGFNEYVGASGYSVTTQISSLNSITIRITKSSAFSNVSNNTLISLSGYIKLTLH